MGSFFRRLGEQINRKTRYFMMGRYGTDKLNMTILMAGLAMSVIVMFIRFPLLDLILTCGSYTLMFWAIFRMLSRNTYKRYQENRRYLRLLERLKDREHRYLTAPAAVSRYVCPGARGKLPLPAPSVKKSLSRKPETGHHVRFFLDRGAK